jgi:hypothetical protein
VAGHESSTLSEDKSIDSVLIFGEFNPYPLAHTYTHTSFMYKRLKFSREPYYMELKEMKEGKKMGGEKAHIYTP